MIAFIDDHREAYGVEPICKVLLISPPTYHDHVATRRDPSRLSARAKRDAAHEARYFRNGRVAVYWGAVAIGSTFILLTTRQVAFALASAVIGLFAAQAVAANLIGVIVRNDHVSLPRPLLPVIPVLSLWRTRIPLAHLRDANGDRP